AEGVIEQIELGLPADEGSGDGRKRRLTVERCGRTVGRNRIPEAAQLERAGFFGLDPPLREAVRRLADQDLARRSRLLQARRDVDGLAGRERRVGLVHDDLAGLDSDPGLDAQLTHALEDPEAGANRPLGVVLVRLW